MQLYSGFIFVHNNEYIVKSERSTVMQTASIAESDADTNQANSEFLIGTGYHVLSVSDREEAISVLYENKNRIRRA